MLQWTKAAIRRVIWSRKQDRWLRRMRELNIPVHTCEVCSRQVTSNHRCVPTGLAVPAPGDTPYSRKELIVSQQGKNLSLKPKVVVNSDKLREELEKMTSILAQKEELAYQQEQFTEALLGLADALVTDPSYGTSRHGSASQATAADRPQEPENAPSRDGSFSPEQGSLPLTTACRLPEETPSRRRRSSTSFPLQFLRLTQGSQDYHGLVDTGSQINLIDANLAATLVRDDAPLADAGATEVRGITGNNTPILGWATLTLCLPTGEAVSSPFALVDRPPARIVIGLPFMHEGYLEHAPHEGTLRSPAGLIRLTLAPSRGSAPEALAPLVLD
ncbi:MAG: uncharacterized protein KVP18_003777 [Porospora cf. gigantea A]|nr:MAG: hypothetical protein KVP18_003777 [Porospora cf. gigantea A]